MPILIHNALTLYMMAILLRWLAPFLQVDIMTPRLRWVPRLADPIVVKVRGALPNLGPFDFAPIATVILIFLAREILMAMMGVKVGTL